MMCRLRRIPLFLYLMASLGVAPAILAEEAPAASGPIQALIRYPTVHGDDVVFEAGGDLWKTTLAGGTATQLTADSGFDMAPHFSPDGRWIAFTGWYEGNTDVYVIPAAGGPVRRLTWHSINEKVGKDKLQPAPDNTVVGWTPDGKAVVFLSRRNSFNPQVMHAWTVPLAGGLPAELPLPWTGPLSFNATGREVAYNKLDRVLRPYHRKHYFGGQAQDVWIYDFDTHKVRQITHWKGADVWPMWHGDTIYFTSDRGVHGVQNLWAYSLGKNHFSQITHFDTYDVDWPTLGDDGIALSDGGDLYVYTFSDRKLHKIDVRVPLNGIAALPHWIDAGKHVDSAAVAPNGKLAVFSAWGALFTVPAKHGGTVTLTHDPGADERDPAWSPDGKTIAYLYAKGSRDAIALRSASGGAPRLLTRGAGVSYQGPIRWSPNGQWLTYVDSNQNLWLQNVKTGRRYKIATDPSGRVTFTDLAWSPGSDWLAFSKTLADRKSGLFLYHLTDHSLHGISSGQFDDYAPAFSDDGKYLFFASRRLVNPAFGQFDTIMAGLDASGLYAATLAADTASPLAPREPEPIDQRPAHPTPKGGAKGAAEHTGPLRIDLTGLMSRAVQLPVPAANITAVVAAKGVVYYTTQPDQILGGKLSGETPQVRAYDLAKRKDLTLDSGGDGLMLSADGSTLLYQSKGKWVLRPARFDAKSKDEALDLAQVRRWVYPRAEWTTSFGEAWRNVRDYFFDPDLIKSEWDAIGQRYRRLLPLAASRNDVTWLIANMMGTFGESHMYVRGGEPDQIWKTPATTTADLGAEFALDPASGRYKLSRIYQGDNTIPGYRAPLAQPGLKVSVGDYVLAINGQQLKAPMNPYALLNGTYGTVVSLLLAHDAAGRNAWTIRVEPVANAAKLHLLAWIRHNREEVDKLSGGRIGYVYLEDMGATGMREFIRQYYSQMRKQAIIFDDRWNLGGFIDPFLFDRIDRPLTGMVTNRYGWADPTPNAFHGYMAALINRGSASDGDIFAYMFKADHLGPTIGSRTWAGVRGYDGPFRLFDGVDQIVSDNGMYGLQSQWVVENIGVSPDVTVHDEPGDLNRGYDAQLQTAVRILMHEIRSAPRTLPPPPPWAPAFPPQPAYPKCTDRMSSGTCG